MSHDIIFTFLEVVWFFISRMELTDVSICFQVWTLLVYDNLGATGSHPLGSIAILRARLARLMLYSFCFIFKVEGRVLDILRFLQFGKAYRKISESQLPLFDGTLTCLSFNVQHGALQEAVMVTFKGTAKRRVCCVSTISWLGPPGFHHRDIKNAYYFEHCKPLNNFGQSAD